MVNRLLFLLMLSVCVCNAGIIRVITYPVRHPHRLVRHTGHVVKVIVW